MKSEYFSPELEIVKLNLYESLLNTSIDEDNKDEGVELEERYQ